MSEKNKALDAIHDKQNNTNSSISCKLNKPLMYPTACQDVLVNVVHVLSVKNAI